MTAVVYHGPPGSYKTFSVMQDVIIPELIKGRVVVTNIRGLDDLGRIEEVINRHPKGKTLFKKPEYIELPDTAEIISLPHNLEGFAEMAKFHHWAPLGALIVMDEGQRVYPTRLRSLSEFDFPGGPEAAQEQGRPFSLEQAFDQHRHYNWDIYITTTNIDKIHREIRQVCEYGYRHRDISGVLPWYKNMWRDVKHDPSNNGTAKSHEILFRKRKADVKLFDCYQSTATGVAKDSAENKSVFANNKLKVMLLLIVVCVSVLFYRAIEFAQGDKARPVDSLVSERNSAVSGVRGDSGGYVQPDPLQHSNHVPDVDPYLTRILDRYSLEYLGHFGMSGKVRYYWRVTDNDTLATFTASDTDLHLLGISATVIGCFVDLAQNEIRHLTTCANREPPPQPRLALPERAEPSAPSAVLLEHNITRTVEPMSGERGRGSNATSRASRASGSPFVPDVNQPVF